MKAIELESLAEEKGIFLPVGLYLPGKEVSQDDAIAHLEKMKKGVKLPPIHFEFQKYADVMIYWQKVLSDQQPYLEISQDCWRGYFNDQKKSPFFSETPTKCIIYRLFDTEEAAKIIEMFDTEDDESPFR